MFAKNFKSCVTLISGDGLSISALNTVTDKPLDFVVAQGQQAHTIGLVRFEDDGSYVKVFSGLEVIKVGQSVKKVNKKKVKRILNEKLQEMEQEFIAANPTKEFFLDKESKKAIEADIVFSLLPETEADDFYNYVVVDTENSITYVLNGSKKISEDIAVFLREVLGTFPVLPFSVHEEAIIKGFDTILEEHEAERLTLGNYIKLEDSEGVVVWSKESLYESRAVELMEDGKHVVAIGLEYDGFVNFIVDKEFKLSGIKFPKYFNDEEGSFEASVLLCFNEIRGIMQDLIKSTIQK
ncbi:putative recombination protein [Escherichia phage JohannJBalmer]|nr:putative exonuclease [Escherichia phage outra]QXV81574.1 putative recombination protein [Escherichia phage JohannJBalmer]QXV83968.1 putative recombination protein [Escherichia phage PaulScherrer]